MNDVTMPGITAIVPAFNEAASIQATIESLQRQTLGLAEILVVDDCSTDGTGGVAAALGARVIRPPSNTGSKAGAQNFALGFVETEFCIAIDADTEVADDGVELLALALRDSDAAAVCGFVIPRRVSTIWERGRYIEYLFAFTFYKPIQDYFGRPLISSGCFSAYRTQLLREAGGWSTRTMAEDMDLTWTLYARGHGVRFVPEAICYPIEPADLLFLGKQLKRWSHGFVQNVKTHRREIIEIPYLRTMVGVAVWDATVASLAFLLVLPAGAALVHPLFLLGYGIDLPAVAVPVVVAAYGRGELGRAILSLPCFLALRIINALYMARAVWSEVVLRRPLLVYEKGH